MRAGDDGLLRVHTQPWRAVSGCTGAGPNGRFRQDAAADASHLPVEPRPSGKLRSRRRPMAQKTDVDFVTLGVEDSALPPAPPELSPLGAAALAYAHQGKPLSPLLPGTEPPLTPHGFKNPTTAPA